MQETQEKLLEHFDTQIHDLLKIQHQRAEAQLDRISRLFWRLTQHQLKVSANFNNDKLQFELIQSPLEKAPNGRYSLIQKGVELPEHCHLYRLSHPLGAHVLDSGRRLQTPVQQVTFDLSNHGTKVSALEPFLNRSGWLELNQLDLDSFQHEEHLVFTAITTDREMLDPEHCDQLFQLSATTSSMEGSHTENVQYLTDTAKRQLDATLSRALEENNQYFQREREKLDAWAQDQIVSVEANLEDTRARLKEAKKQSRIADTVEAQKSAQEAVKELEKLQRRQRQEIFDVEDEIESRRDALIDALEQQMHQHSSSHLLFRIHWKLV